MDSNGSAGESPHGLTDLPLNVIFRILSYLDLKELQNIGKSCKLLRILANENLMLTNNLVELNSRRDQWTRRLIFDVFDIFNGSRNIILRLTTAYHMSLVESIRIVQKNYGLGYLRKDKEEQTHYSETLLKSDEGISESRCHNNHSSLLEEKTDRRIQRETMTYLEILQGFHNICLSSTEGTIKRDTAEEPWEDSDHEVSLEENLSEVDQDIESDVGTPTQSNRKYFDTTKQRRISSPTSSDYSKSSSISIFSELPPKLSSRSWHSSIYELEHISDHLNASSCEDGSSSSESIDKLRRSNKVKDKAALFEKLISNDYSMSNDQKKLKKKKSHDIIPSISNGNKNNLTYVMGKSLSSTKRNISRGYIEELERCNMMIAGLPTGGQEMNECFSTAYHLPLNEKEDTVPISCQKKVESSFNMQLQNSNEFYKSRSRKLQKSVLKAFVTEDNKICYEKL